VKQGEKPEKMMSERGNIRRLDERRKNKIKQESEKVNNALGQLSANPLLQRLLFRKEFCSEGL
jgi:hypothetical protein